MVTQKIVAGSAKNNSIPWLFIAPALLLATHVMVGIALFTFGQRVGNLPINPVGLAVYLTTTISLGIAFLLGANRARRGWSFLRMLLLSLPAFASLALHATLWLTGWLGNAPYAPWKVGGDSGSVIYLNLIFIFSWLIIATIYGSYRYLLTGGTIQIAVYFAAHALPHLSRFPEANPLGVQPEVPIQLVGLVVLGGFLVAGRKSAFPDFQPPLWVAVLLLTAVGSFTFFIAWSRFPENGMVLGWTETLTAPPRQVPANAWNWMRPAASLLLILAAAAVPVSGFAHWYTSREK